MGDFNAQCILHRQCLHLCERHRPTSVRPRIKLCTTQVFLLSWALIHTLPKSNLQPKSFVSIKVSLFHQLIQNSVLGLTEVSRSFTTCLIKFMHVLIFLNNFYMSMGLCRRSSAYFGGKKFTYDTWLTPCYRIHSQQWDFSKALKHPRY